MFEIFSPSGKFEIFLLRVLPDPESAGPVLIRSRSDPESAGPALNRDSGFSEGRSEFCPGLGSPKGVPLPGSGNS